MTQLLLSKDDGNSWQRVYFSAESNGFKLTRENPYFTSSETYTLDVSLPMDILENRQFLQNLQRIDASKPMISMKCRLMVDNRLVLVGTARVTQVTHLTVKVQLLGGRSEVNFLGSDDYIDELPLGRVNAATWADDEEVAVSVVTDETKGASTSCWQFQLLFLVRKVLGHYGFSLDQCDIDREPWNRLFVATAKRTAVYAHVLPHWTPREFLTEVCRFFNLTMQIDEVAKTVRLLAVPEFFADAQLVKIVPVEEYTVEMAEESDARALAADNLMFDMSSSPSHDYDIIPEDVRENVRTVDYPTYDAAAAAYESMGENERMRQVFRCPLGSFAGWDFDFSAFGLQSSLVMLTQIDVFRPLMRENAAGDTELKIVPVAIGDWDTSVHWGSDEGGYSVTQHTIGPTLENPTGNERTTVSLNGIFGGNMTGAGEEESATVQEYVMGDETVTKKGEKEDRLQVMFIDDVMQKAVRVRSDDPENFVQYNVRAGFTDWRFRQNPLSSSHRLWSLSLNPTDATYYLGQLHRNGFSFNMKARHVFRFYAEQMPDPASVFIVRNKRYGCEKIEASVNEDGFDHLMTGYFYEMTC